MPSVKSWRTAFAKRLSFHKGGGAPSSTTREESNNGSKYPVRSPSDLAPAIQPSLSCSALHGISTLPQDSGTLYHVESLCDIRRTKSLQQVWTCASDTCSTSHVTLSCDVWADDDDQVYIIGSFNKWTKLLPMTWDESFQHTVQVVLPRGLHYYQILVNGRVFIDRWKPIGVDEKGRRCNMICVF